MDEQLIEFIISHPGLTAREIAEGLFGKGAPQQKVYFRLQRLHKVGRLTMHERADHLKAYTLSTKPGGIDRKAMDPRPADPEFEKKLAKATADVIKRLKQDPNDRMHSWSHCFKSFHEFRMSQSATLEDLAALHLAFFLASYGMYRGSTSLLRKDYKFLAPVVRQLVSKPYQELAVSPAGAADATHPSRADLLYNLCEDLERTLDKIGIGQKHKGTLVTKILLGTWCNVPAFDTAFKQALRSTGFGKAVWNRKNFVRAFNALHANATAFQKQIDEFHSAGYTDYPAVRVIDAIFWHLGGGDKKTAEGSIMP